MYANTITALTPSVSARPQIRKRIAAQPIPLTHREIQFLDLTANGNTAREIAEQLDVTERTANFHIKSVMKKLGAANKTHAVALAMRRGIIG